MQNCIDSQTKTGCVILSKTKEIKARLDELAERGNQLEE